MLVMMLMKINEPMNEWMNEWMTESMNEWMNEWKNEWMNESIDEWMNEWSFALIVVHETNRVTCVLYFSHTTLCVNPHNRPTDRSKTYTDTNIFPRSLHLLRYRCTLVNYSTILRQHCMVSLSLACRDGAQFHGHCKVDTNTKIIPIEIPINALRRVTIISAVCDIMVAPYKNTYFEHRNPLMVCAM